MGRRRGCAVALGLFLLLALLGGAILMLRRSAERAERDRRAPVVLHIAATSCALSPGGSYLLVGEEHGSGGVYEARSGGPVALTPPPGAVGATWMWLSDDALLLYTRATTVGLGTANPYTKPEDGWIVDVPSGVARAVADLAPADREAALRGAGEYYRTLGERTRPPVQSPSGEYSMSGLHIQDRSGRVVNEVPPSVDYGYCTDGWRPDSVGFYFIDRPRAGLRFRGGPGPVRLLLTQPPPPGR